MEISIRQDDDVSAYATDEDASAYSDADGSSFETYTGSLQEKEYPFIRWCIPGSWHRHWPICVEPPPLPTVVHLLPMAENKEGDDDVSVLSWDDNGLTALGNIESNDCDLPSGNGDSYSSRGPSTVVFAPSGGDATPEATDGSTSSAASTKKRQRSFNGSGTTFLSKRMLPLVPFTTTHDAMAMMPEQNNSEVPQRKRSLSADEAPADRSSIVSAKRKRIVD